MLQPRFSSDQLLQLAMASLCQGTGIMPGISEKVRQMAGITNWAGRLRVHPAVALLGPLACDIEDTLGWYPWKRHIRSSLVKN
eukprot:s550_g3.t1